MTVDAAVRRPTRWAVVVLAAAALAGFAGNSLLCRLALAGHGIDAASFTTLRIASGALVLWLLARPRARRRPAGSWTSAAALFVYAAGFSLAYVELTTATGALLLFGAVQVTMLAVARWRGERLGAVQGVGMALALCGMAALLWPGLAAPPPASAVLMLLAGAAWGVYSLRGQAGGDALAGTAGNFLRALPMAIGLSLVTLSHAHLEPLGVGSAVLSGALASGLGYAAWYAVLPWMTAARAAALQLSVPVLAAAGGVAWLGEPIGPRLVWSSLAVMGGIGLVIIARLPRRPAG